VAIEIDLESSELTEIIEMVKGLIEQADEKISQLKKRVADFVTSTAL